jgi:hypothetical protein
MRGQGDVLLLAETFIAAFIKANVIGGPCLEGPNRT